MWIERQADDLHLVSLERVVQLTSVCIPDLRLAIEGTCDDLVTVRVVEGHRIHYIRVVVQ